jgi:hypothetical protein
VAQDCPGLAGQQLDFGTGWNHRVLFFYIHEWGNAVLLR